MFQSPVVKALVAGAIVLLLLVPRNGSGPHRRAPRHEKRRGGVDWYRFRE